MATGAKRGPKTQTPNLPIEVIKFLLDNELPELKPRPDYFDTFASECRIFKEMDVGPKRRMRRSATLDTYRCSGGIRGARDLPPSQQPVCRRRYGKVVGELDTLTEFLERLKPKSIFAFLRERRHQHGRRAERRVHERKCEM